MVEASSDYEVVKKKSTALRVATGGLIKHRKEVKRTTNTSDTREGFIEIFPREGPSILLLETGLIYDGMGMNKQPTRLANFNALFQVLNERSSGAKVDDRLMSRGNQVRILGSLLTPEDNVDVAITLVAHALLGS